LIVTHGPFHALRPDVAVTALALLLLA